MDLIELGRRAGVEGFLHCAELERLVDLAAGRDVLEVGSFKGLSAWGMAFGARSLLCVDTFRANSAGQTQQAELTTYDDFCRATARYRNVEVFIGTSEAAGAALEGRTFDMVFIDAMHTYEDVKADILRWWPRVRPGGVMAMHDYNHRDFPGVTVAADEVLGPAADVTVTLRVQCKS